MPLPENGAYISDITLYTPYAQVVLNSWMNSSDYSAQQAEKDYGAGDELIRVRVRIEFTPTYSAVQMKHDDDGSGQDVFVPRSENFWKDFRFELIQDNSVILPRSVHAAPIYDDGGFRGAEIWQEYDAKKVPSEDSTVRVVTPDGQIFRRYDERETTMDFMTSYSCLPAPAPQQWSHCQTRRYNNS